MIIPQMILTALVMAGSSAEVEAVLALDDIPITVLNTWQAPYASEILDLSWVCDGGGIAFRSNADHRIFLADLEDGSSQGEKPIPSDWTGFGLEISDGSEYYVTDTSTGHIMHSSYPSYWESFDNPAGSGDGALAWSYNGMGASMAEGCGSDPGRFYAFGLSGGDVETYELPEVAGSISGVAAHEFYVSGASGAPHMLVVTCFDDPEFYFYYYHTGLERYLLYGQEPCPVPVQQSLGIELIPDRGTFFWSYQGTDGEYYVSELDIPILGGLESSTWGSIKVEAAE
jgi:hypothetical protein